MTRLLVLTGHPTLATPTRWLEAARTMGVDAHLVTLDPWWRAPDAESESPGADGAILVARPGAFQFRAMLQAHRRWTQAGARPAQSRRALRVACDQWATLRALAAAGVPTPPTVWAPSPKQFASALERVQGPPWFVKGRLGSKGSHVQCTRNRAEAMAALARLWGQGGSPLLQRDLRATGPVQRVLATDREALARVEAIPAAGEARTNWHRGGRFEPWPLEGPAIPRALAALRAVGLPFGAVDFIGRDPVVLEVNASPGLEGIERATGLDLATPLIQRCLETA